MNNALASVKGTAYGLGDAATTASQLVASGVQQGDQLTSVLKTVGDSAQISGRDFTEMGSIFSKVAASNKLQGEQVNQILDSGIPILQFLAKHYGITAEEAQKMVSSGKVDFENFAAAMQENLGGAAQSAGTTFKGAMANVKAAFSRLGEKAMTPVLNGLRDIFNAAIPLVDAVTTKLTPVFEQWGDLVSNTIAPKIVDAFGKITDVLSGDSFSGFSNGILAAIPVVGSLVAAMGGTGLLGTIGEQGKLTPELRQRIDATWDATALEDIYLPYKPLRASWGIPRFSATRSSCSAVLSVSCCRFSPVS